MTIETILRNKGNAVITIGTFSLVPDAMHTMVDCKVAALVLFNGAEVNRSRFRARLSAGHFGWRRHYP